LNVTVTLTSTTTIIAMLPQPGSYLTFIILSLLLVCGVILVMKRVLARWEHWYMDRPAILIFLVVISLVAVSVGLFLFYGVTVGTTADWTMVLLTMVLVSYTGITIQEAQKNRKKSTIERQLEKLYSPLYEILERARYESSVERNAMRSKPPESSFALSLKEFDRISSIVERYGHYLDDAERLRLKVDLQKHTTKEKDSLDEVDLVRREGIWYCYTDIDMERHLMFMKDKREKLRNALYLLSR